MKNTKRSLLGSVLALLLCFAMLIGSTFAWFTDSVTSAKNKIVAGNLDVELEYLNADGEWTSVEGKTDLFDQHALWEPGHTEVVYLRVLNLGTLALKYRLGLNIADEIGSVNVLDEEFKLSDFIQFGAVNDVDTPYADRKDARDAVTDASPIREGYTKENAIKAGDPAQYVALVVYMPEDVGNGANYKTGCAVPRIELGVTLVATQMTDESDDFGDTYDEKAEFPQLNLPVGVTVPVTPTADGKVSEEGVGIANEDGSVIASLAAGTQLEEGTTALTLTVTDVENSQANVTAGENEVTLSVDVHITGVAKNNATPIKIYVKKMLPAGLNIGNYHFYHVENGETVEMTLLSDTAEPDHNYFDYDPATGDVVLYMATFSEVAVVADTENAWEGEFDYSWYGASATELTIANADQLAAFGAIVGGMKDQTRDSFSGKTVKLLADINLGDKDNENESLIFYPIGYYYTDDKNADGTTGDYYSTVKSFEGTFDGNGNKISNFYQNTWEIKGDYDGNYYSDAMGLFGYVVNGTVKNLTVDNFSSDGEFTPTGVVAAYAVNSTFENIAITNCNPRVYNTGNGGIIGIAGDTSTADDDHITLKNITVDNSNKISALWGSWDVACGGLVGMFRGAGHAYMTNCHVAAQIDVNNDVCGNYQYYWYRYSGMMIGTNKNMTTDENGYTVPETSKFHAENCTVHFGDWNDYYYCELVANSLASYTHDHQFSRLEQISSLDEIKSGDTWTKAGNFLLINGDTKTCYHIVTDNNGTLKQHLHTDAGEETVNGETVLKEDKQIVYLPFNQLFTGYGWGVKHIPVYNGEDYAFEGITILDREYANSVTKFDKAENAQDSYKTETTVTIGELFKAATIEDSKLSIKSDNVQVTVSPAYGTNSTAGATYTPNTTDWTQGTLTFSGLGVATVTITDYYFCVPTTISITVAEPDSVDKFDLVFENTDDYLYRVGNANAVALGSLFKAKDGVEIGNVTVTVTALNGAIVSGTYTANADDWTQGTIQFSGTGPVLITIDDDAYANEKTLYLEVVDATNVTTYSGLGNKNSVFLNDITMSSGSSYYLSGATLYGNGFTFDMTDGTYAAGGNTSANYVFGLNNANLDNVKIVGAVYTTYGATVQSEYNRAAVLSTGNNTITNCYISNCASAVRVKDGNLEMINTTVKGGNFANIDIRGGNVVLDNVTTINQVKGNDTAADGTMVVGFGVVIYYENVLNTTTLEIRNGITQYNHLSETQFDTYITDTTAKQLKNTIYGSGLSAVQYNDGSDIWVNTGILSMTSEVGDANITDVDGYVDASPEMTGVTGYLHTKKPDATSIAATAPEYATAGQGTIAPSYSFDYTTKNYVAKTEGSNDYCYEESGTVYISMDAGDTFNWDTSILTATKNGQTLSYTVTMNGTDYTGKSITFNTAGSYEVTYTYTDDNNYGVDENGNITTYSKAYTKTVHISVAAVEASAKKAEFTMGSSNAATEKITVDNVTYISATGVTADNSTWTYMTVGSEKIYYPIIAAKLTSTKGSSTYAYFPVFENAITITDYADGGTGAAVIYNSSTTTLPSGLTAVKGVYKAAADVSSWTNLNNSHLEQSGASKIFKWASGSDAPSDPTTYNNVLCYQSPSISKDRAAYLTLVQYSYTDATNTTYYYYVGYTLEAFTYQGGCVTPDTLVTLADGTQKEIQYVTYEDQLLVWNFYTGEYTTAPASIVMNHGYSNVNVVTLTFADGTTVNTINGHGFFDVASNAFVILDESNAPDYIGHEFVKQDGDGYTTTALVDVSVEERYTEVWSVLTAEHYNCILEGMWTVTAAEVANSPAWLMPYKIGEDMKYDEAAMQADIEKYGLYTYDDFADYCTYEQFKAFGFENFKVSIGKGYITWDEILYLIGIHIG